MRLLHSDGLNLATRLNNAERTTSNCFALVFVKSKRSPATKLVCLLCVSENWELILWSHLLLTSSARTDLKDDAKLQSLLKNNTFLRTAQTTNERLQLRFFVQVLSTHFPTTSKSYTFLTTTPWKIIAEICWTFSEIML